MQLTADILRFLLILTLLGMALLAAFYLRSRRISEAAYLGWGLLIIFLPLLGPFLVILSQPGKPVRRRARR